jgi:PKD repeat protein
VSEIALSGSPLAGSPLGLGVTASDAWSAVAAPGWTFGDATAGSGVSVSHTYAQAGTYTSIVTVADASGNAVTRQVTSTIGALQSTLTSAKFSAKWKASRVKGTLTVTGTAPRAGTYTVDVFSGKVRKLHVGYALTAGAFSKALKLPAKLLPGTYRVALVPAFPAGVVAPAAGTAKLAAPAEGVVDKVVLSGKNGGPAARTLKSATTIWASFRFAAVPKGALKLTWYKTVKGKRSSLGSTTKSPAKKVGSYLKLDGKLNGTFTAVLSRKGKVIAQGSVKAV